MSGRNGTFVRMQATTALANATRAGFASHSPAFSSNRVQSLAEFVFITFPKAIDR
jgi:hypothetical protein